MCAVTRSLLVRLVDHRAVHIGRQLLVLPVAVVDPDLDDVDLLRRELLHRLAGFRRGGDPVRRGRAARLRRGEPAAGREEARRAGNRLARISRHVVVVLPMLIAALTP